MRRMGRTSTAMCRPLAAAGVAAVVLAMPATGRAASAAMSQQAITSTAAMTSGPAAGGTMTKYADGAVTFRPPSGFNPAAATADQRAAYGIPDKPTSAGPALDRWNDMVANMHFAPVAPAMYSSPASADGYLPSTTCTSNCYWSKQWSGYVNSFPGQPQNVYESFAYFYEPLPGSTTCPASGTPADLVWTGAGGFNQGSLPLAQAGTSPTLQPAIGQGMADEGWWEIYPQNTIQFDPSVPATPGQPYSVNVQYVGNKAGVGPNTVEFGLYNTYTHAYDDIFVNSTNGWKGDSGESVVERPSLNGSPTSLASFNEVLFLETLTNNAYAQYSGIYAPITMATGLGAGGTFQNRRAEPDGPPSSYGGFGTFWFSC